MSIFWVCVATCLGVICHRECYQCAGIFNPTCVPCRASFFFFNTRNRKVLCSHCEPGRAAKCVSSPEKLPVFCFLWRKKKRLKVCSALQLIRLAHHVLHLLIVDELSCIRESWELRGRFDHSDWGEGDSCTTLNFWWMFVLAWNRSSAFRQADVTVWDE